MEIEEAILKEENNAGSLEPPLLKVVEDDEEEAYVESDELLLYLIVILLRGGRWKLNESQFPILARIARIRSFLLSSFVYQQYLLRQSEYLLLLDWSFLTDERASRILMSAT